MRWADAPFRIFVYRSQSIVVESGKSVLKPARWFVTIRYGSAEGAVLGYRQRSFKSLRKAHTFAMSLLGSTECAS